MEKQSSPASVLKLTQMAMLSSIAVILGTFIQFPLIPGVHFLYNPGDVFLIIGALLWGPWSGFAMTVAVSLIKFMFLGNFAFDVIIPAITTGPLVLTAGLIYRHTAIANFTIRLMVSLASASVVLCGLGIPIILFVLPLFTGMSYNDSLSTLPVSIPFDLLRCTINSVLAFFLFKFIIKSKIINTI